MTKLLPLGYVFLSEIICEFWPNKLSVIRLSDLIIEFPMIIEESISDSIILVLSPIEVYGPT